jgi:hypothetical protein
MVSAWFEQKVTGYRVQVTRLYFQTQSQVFFSLKPETCNLELKINNW